MYRRIKWFFNCYSWNQSRQERDYTVYTVQLLNTKYLKYKKDIRCIIFMKKIFRALLFMIAINPTLYYSVPLPAEEEMQGCRGWVSPGPRILLGLTGEWGLYHASWLYCKDHAYCTFPECVFSRGAVWSGLQMPLPQAWWKPMLFLERSLAHNSYRLSSKSLWASHMY